MKDHSPIGFTIEQFNEWLKNQPDDRTFRYSDTRNCLVASFLKEYFGFDRVSVGSVSYDVNGNKNIDYSIPYKIVSTFRVVKNNFSIKDFNYYYN